MLVLASKKPTVAVMQIVDFQTKRSERRRKVHACIQLSKRRGADHHASDDAKNTRDKVIILKYGS